MGLTIIRKFDLYPALSGLEKLKFTTNTRALSPGYYITSFQGLGMWTLEVDKRHHYPVGEGAGYKVTPYGNPKRTMGFKTMRKKRLLRSK
jgi:hypothetical protein